MAEDSLSANGTSGFCEVFNGPEEDEDPDGGSLFTAKGLVPAEVEAETEAPPPLLAVDFGALEVRGSTFTRGFRSILTRSVFPPGPCLSPLPPPACR